MAKETPRDIDPFYISDPENAEHLRERARNTSNVNPHPTTVLPVKSQAVEGPTASPGVQALADAEQAVVNPQPTPGGVPPSAETPDDKKSSGSSRSK